MINKILFSSIVSVSLSLFLQTAATAGIYKWVDDSGQIHYGEQPGNSDAKRVTIRKNETTTPRTMKTEEKADDNKESESSTTEAEKPKKPQISKKEKRKLCHEARNDIATISSRGRMREINTKGEYTYLSEKQRQNRLSAARKKLRKYCR